MQELQLESIEREKQKRLQQIDVEAQGSVQDAVAKVFPARPTWSMHKQQAGQTTQ
jgi:hypothetical protein